MPLIEIFNPTNDPIKERLLTACQVGDLNIIKEIINSLSEKPDELLNEALCYATATNLASVIYLLVSPEIKFHSDISAVNNSPLYNACFHQKVDIVNFLLTSSELEKHADIHHNKDFLFKTLCSQKNHVVVKYLICEYGIERTKYINDYLKNSPQSIVESFFEIRKLNADLNKNLPNSHIVDKKTKV